MVWRGRIGGAGVEQLLKTRAGATSTTWWSTCLPARGDIQLTLAQKVPVTGAVISPRRRTSRSSMPARASRCFEKVGIPILWRGGEHVLPRLPEIAAI